MRAAPVRTLLVPIAVFILLCTLGLCGVLYAASQRSADDKNNVRNGIATEIATGLKLQLETTQSATAAVTAYIKQQPSCAGLVTAFPKLAATGWAWSGSGGSGATSSDVKTTLMAVQAAPAGLLIHFYPSSPTDPVGLDLLGDARRRETTLAAVAADRLTLQGPFVPIEGGWAAFTYYPIFLPVTSPNETWGCQQSAGDCPEELCYRPAHAGGGHEKLWGLAFTMVNMLPLQDGSDARLKRLAAQGFRYRLSRPETATAKGILIAESGAAPVDPVGQRIEVYDVLWQLDVAPARGWVPTWRDPCIAAVVVGAFVVAVLQLRLTLSQERHTMLLREMLPRQAIAHLEQGRSGFVEQFECVTILFSDIVHYTDLAATLSPLEVVTLLNELYFMFDALSRKHGVYKVETIGDAFMCVSGCPTPEAAAAAAARMAGMARDMVESVRTWRSSTGHSLRIRVGVHSGPAVAGVVGDRMPRYCLFGDTVNTASRMESTCVPMACQVSAATRALLDEAGVATTWRGIIQVKGKGKMDTSWLVAPTPSASACDSQRPAVLGRAPSMSRAVSASRRVSGMLPSPSSYTTTSPLNPSSTGDNPLVLSPGKADLAAAVQIKQRLGLAACDSPSGEPDKAAAQQGSVPQAAQAEPPAEQPPPPAQQKHLPEEQQQQPTISVSVEAPSASATQLRLPVVQEHELHAQGSNEMQ